VSHDQHLEGMTVFKFDNAEPRDGNDGHDHDHDGGHSEPRGQAPEGREGDESGPEDLTPTAQTALIAAVVVVSAALLIALLIFLFLRYSLPRRLGRLRRRPDTQELTASVATIDPVEQGYLEDGSASGAESDEQRTAADYLASLTSRVWQIPRNFLEVNTEVVGRGRFGTVMRATVHQGATDVVCTAQIIPNRLLDDEDRQRMLRELDLNIRAGAHGNLVSLVGICEELETTMVVLEAAELPLKQFLLDGRALLTHPSYAEKAGRFATVREDTMLGILADVGRGAEHLTARCGIQHGRLCARLVHLVSGPGGQHLAKISGFGLADLQRGNERLDPTRWSSPEALLGKRTEAMFVGNKSASTSPADVWSFGCLLWEVTTLGKDAININNNINNEDEN